MNKRLFLEWFVGFAFFMILWILRPTWVVVIGLFLFMLLWTYRVYRFFEQRQKSFELISSLQYDRLTKEHQLKNQQLETLMRHIPSPLALIDLQGDFVIFNDNFRRLTQGESPVSYTDVRIPLPIRNFIRESYLNEKSTYQILRYQSTDYQAISIPIFQLNRYAGMLIVLQDITPALEKERMQKRFIADASHELKTPISAIKGMVEILNRPEFEDEETAKEFLVQIALEVNRLQGIVEDMLTMSKIHANKLILDLQPVDITAIVDQAVATIRPVLLAKQIAYKGPTKALRTVFADGKQLIQVFDNLLHNAAQYTSNGMITVTIEENEKEYLISIKDTGVGIEEKDLPYIFERFYRSAQDRARSKGGSGLGLAIVKSIITAHQGRVEVFSKVNEGTTFTVVLPKIN